MKLIKNNIGIVVLLIAALILGGLVILKFAPNIKLPSLSKESAPTPVAQKTEAVDNSSLPEFAKKLSSEMQKVLSVPPPNAPIDVRKAHYDLVKRVAIEADYLEMADCRPVKPIVMKVEAGKKIILKNSSSEDHTMYMNKDTSFTVKANSSLSIAYEFPKGDGVYGYGCDHTPYPVGFFLVYGSKPSPTDSVR